MESTLTYVTKFSMIGRSVGNSRISFASGSTGTGILKLIVIEDYSPTSFGDVEIEHSVRAPGEFTLTVRLEFLSIGFDEESVVATINPDFDKVDIGFKKPLTLNFIKLVVGAEIILANVSVF
jgi:hypothetical protein